jgi:hypothetical protein
VNFFSFLFHGLYTTITQKNEISNIKSISIKNASCWYSMFVAFVLLNLDFKGKCKLSLIYETLNLERK